MARTGGAADVVGHRAPGYCHLVNAPGAGAPDGGVGRDPPDQARLGQLAEEQAALRRVATLVAHGAAPEEVFTVVAGEVGQLLPVDSAALCRYEPDGALTFVSQWGSVTTQFPVGSRWMLGGHNVGTLVFQTGRPARVDGYAESSSGALGAGIREAGLRSAVGTPIIVEGRLWGLIPVALQREQPLPADTEARLASFTELVATAIANTDSRAALARLAEEQAALRRVAMLVARATAPEEVFAAVAGEVGGLLEVDYTVLIRSDPEDMITVVGAWTATGVAAPSPVGSRFELGGRNVSTLALRTGRRPAGRLRRRHGQHREHWRSRLGLPLVGGRADQRRGAAVGPHPRGLHPRPAPAGRHRGAAGFLHRAGRDGDREHREPCLSRPASRGAGSAAARRDPGGAGAAPEQVFAAVTEEMARLLPVDLAGMARYDPDGTLTYVASWGKAVDYIPVGSRWSGDGKNIATDVFETGRPARVESQAGATGSLAAAAREMGMRSSVGTPIMVEGRVWGVMGAGVDPGGAAATGRRGAPGLVHRAGGDSDRERREPRRVDGLPRADRRCRG